MINRKNEGNHTAIVLSPDKPMFRIFPIISSPEVTEASSTLSMRFINDAIRFLFYRVAYQVLNALYQGYKHQIHETDRRELPEGVCYAELLFSKEVA